MWVKIESDAQRDRLWETSGMFFDKRSSGKGLTVGIHVPSLNACSSALVIGDRLLPQKGLEDVFQYAVIATPCWLCFWRPSMATLTTSPNQLWEGGVGMSPVGNFAVDFLHTVSLGVMGSVVCATIWRLLLSDVFVSHGPPKDIRFGIAMSRLSIELNAWYRSEKAKGRTPNEVETLAPGMFGDPEQHMIKTKAGETQDLFRWCATSLLPKYQGRIVRGPKLRSCAHALLDWYVELSAQPDLPSEDACARLKSLALRHLVQLRRAGIPRRPKHHLFWHLNTRTRSPSSHTIWRYVHLRMQPHAPTRAHTHTYIYAYVYNYMYIYTYIHLYMCVTVCVCVRIHAYTHARTISAHTHTQLCTRHVCLRPSQAVHHIDHRPIVNTLCINGRATSYIHRCVIDASSVRHRR